MKGLACGLGHGGCRKSQLCLDRSAPGCPGLGQTRSLPLPSRDPKLYIVL